MVAAVGSGQLNAGQDGASISSIASHPHAKHREAGAGQLASGTRAAPTLTRTWLPGR